MNGLEFWFQARIISSIACFKSGTLTQPPRRIALSVNNRAHRTAAAFLQRQPRLSAI
jgi:hypothetical protein